MAHHDERGWRSIASLSKICGQRKRPTGSDDADCSRRCHSRSSASRPQLLLFPPNRDKIVHLAHIAQPHAPILDSIHVIHFDAIQEEPIASDGIVLHFDDERLGKRVVASAGRRLARQSETAGTDEDGIEVADCPSERPPYGGDRIEGRH
jgi:hypothetical protein